jgi:hypothetical protein
MKYSEIFAEVKGYFKIIAPNNQHGRRSSCSIKNQDWYEFDNQPEVVIGFSG